MRIYGLLLLGLIACRLLTFSVEENVKTTVEGAGLLGELLGTIDFTGLDDFDVTIEQKITDQGVNEGDLNSVALTNLELSGEPDLSFLESMDVYVESGDLPSVLVASGSSFPEGEPVVALTPTDADIKDFVAAGDMIFRVEVTGSAPVEDTEVGIYVAVEVTATIQGACGEIK